MPQIVVGFPPVDLTVGTLTCDEALQFDRFNSARAALVTWAERDFLCTKITSAGLLARSPVAQRQSIPLLTEKFKSKNSFLWRQLTASGRSPKTLFLRRQTIPVWSPGVSMSARLIFLEASQGCNLRSAIPSASNQNYLVREGHCPGFASASGNPQPVRSRFPLLEIG